MIEKIRIERFVSIKFQQVIIIFVISLDPKHLALFSHLIIKDIMGSLFKIEVISNQQLIIVRRLVILPKGC